MVGGGLMNSEVLSDIVFILRQCAFIDGEAVSARARMLLFTTVFRLRDMEPLNPEHCETLRDILMHVVAEDILETPLVRLIIESCAAYFSSQVAPLEEAARRAEVVYMGPLPARMEDIVGGVQYVRLGKRRRMSLGVDVELVD